MAESKSSSRYFEVFFLKLTTNAVGEALERKGLSQHMSHVSIFSYRLRGVLGEATVVSMASYFEAEVFL